MSNAIFLEIRQTYFAFNFKIGINRFDVIFKNNKRDARDIRKRRNH